MKNKLLSIVLIVAAVLSASKMSGQSLPAGTCGVVYMYDAAGNRTQRQYMCNNSSMVEDAATLEGQGIQVVNTLYPNPTTGIFSVKLSKPLNKTLVTISDISGSIIAKKTETGIHLTYDLSNYPSGEYIITIHQKPKKITMKVIKSR